MENTCAGRAVYGAMSIAVPSLLLWVVNRATAHWLAWLLAVPSVLLSLLAHFAGMPVLLPWAHALESLLYFYAVSGLIRCLLGDIPVPTAHLVSTAPPFHPRAWASEIRKPSCRET